MTRWNRYPLTSPRRSRIPLTRHVSYHVGGHIVTKTGLLEKPSKKAKMEQESSRHGDARADS